MEQTVKMNHLLVLSEQLYKRISESENKTPYAFNLLDLAGVNEPFTSLILAHIFKYAPEQRNPLCTSFIRRLLQPCGFDMNWVKAPVVTTEKEHIDVCIHEPGKYAIVIENKLKGAVFQRNQLARYIATLRKNNRFRDNQIFIVILPKYHDNKFFQHLPMSVFRLPEDWNSNNQDRACKTNDACRCLCDCGQSCPQCTTCEKDLMQKFSSRTTVVDKELLEWLKQDCLSLIPKKELPLKSAIMQFYDFLNGIFDNRFNQKLAMEIVDFLRDKLLKNEQDIEIQNKSEQWKTILAKINELDELKSGMRELQKQLSFELMQDWRHRILEYADLHKSYNIEVSNIGFRLFIQGVELGCWYDIHDDSEIKPYWGCYAKTEEQRKIVAKILDKAGVPHADIIEWTTGHTLHGDERFLSFIQAAQDLKLLEK